MKYNVHDVDTGTMLYMATPTDLRVAETIRSAAVEQGFTHEALAGALGIARPTMTQRLTGRSRFTVSEVAQLARILGLDLYALLEDDEVPA